jgi:hypothetical protein
MSMRISYCSFTIALLVAWAGQQGIFMDVPCHESACAGANPAEPINVIVVTHEAPDLAPWAAKAEKLVREWHPKISALLTSEGFTPPMTVKLFFEKNNRGVAGTLGSSVMISADYVRKHPDDFGMIIHELTHVIQSYPKYRQIWLVEGIADYVRFFVFEPQTKLAPIDPAKQSYRDGYRTTAQFLAWIVKTYDAELITKLNAALRESRYDDKLFAQSTGKSLDELWAEFSESIRATTKK